MSTEHLMTKKEVAEYLHVSTKAIERWVQQGKLKQCKVPGDMRFNPEYIRSLGLADLNSNEYTPFRCRKLEHENKELRNQLGKYQEIITQMGILAAEANLNILQKEG